MNENQVWNTEVVDRPSSPPPAPKSEPAKSASLFQNGDAEDFRSRWREIQVDFVDEPHRAVEQADQLVASVIQRLAAEFSNQRNTLERGWSHKDGFEGTADSGVSTEDLRQAFQRYRSFFDRLLSV